MTKHAMIDLETLGLAPGCAVLSYGVVIFDPMAQPGDVISTISGRIDLLDAVLCGLTIDPATVEWWRGQDPEARRSLRTGPGLDLLEAVLQVEEFFQEHEQPLVWANGPAADLVWWEAACRAVGRKYPWSHRDARCFRTLVDLTGFDKLQAPNLGVQHDALSDAIWQAQIVQNCYRVLDTQHRALAENLSS